MRPPVDLPVDLSVYLVTDAGQVAARGRDLLDTVRRAVAGGVSAVQVREKGAPARTFLEAVAAIGAVLPEPVALFVNDRVDVFCAARDVGARVTGVHLGQDDLPVAAARALVGPEAVIGLSAATPAQVQPAGTDPGRVDYLGVGVVRATATKIDTPDPLGVAGIADRVRLTSLPVVAIGGVTVADMAPLRACGAAGAAIVSGICAAEDPEAAAGAYAAAWAGRR